MPLTEAQRQAFRQLAAETAGIDVAVYRQFGKDPLEPIIGLGTASAPLCFFGRDPGREEVRHGAPFVGTGGQLVRRLLHWHLYGTEPADFAAALTAGEGFFWLNTVPYKPVGNKAWSMAVKRRFQPLLRQLLVDYWQGRHVITLGREAFFWFAIDQPHALRQQLERFWQREDRFSADLQVQLQDAQGQVRLVVLHPLPHPSPRNRAWLARFPALLQARLAALGVGAPPAV
ncbi:uracil-DNA glycosylase family protein [Stutzerimonas stutzeri]|uniref:uracil-DNA glycosylase family protein n=1 Tax=Stutzerimonas sp. S1 TaxID=3030652 RepID=UPI00222563ED|nr:uracil-DNA glycosylase family protein [Stutzerimonas sp. S1]MCW3149272.1 uracil-DNA glycosylase family protein [Stutzerimonas sp. S1]